MNSRKLLAAASIATTIIATPALAGEKKDQVTLTQCDRSYGTIAIVEGDTQGWAKYGLASPRELIQSMAIQSGCFTPHVPGSPSPADFLMNVIAGDKEEVDQGMAIARTAAVEGIVRSGAAGSVLSKVPMGGAVFGMLGGLGGKRKTIAAGIRLISPSNGQTVAHGTGDAKQTTITLGGAWQQAASNSGYADNKNGKLLIEAFVKAFNALSAQGTSLAALAPAAAPKAATVAVETVMRASALTSSAAVRKLRPGATLTLTGKREGAFVEAADGYGTTGWVSVEDLS